MKRDTTWLCDGLTEIAFEAIMLGYSVETDEGSVADSVESRIEDLRRHGGRKQRSAWNRRQDPWLFDMPCFGMLIAERYQTQI